MIDGRNLSIAGHEGGYFTGPSLVDHVTRDTQIWRDEIFGPVRGIMRAASLMRRSGW